MCEGHFTVYLGAEPPPLSNINLLMAAAISSAWSEVNSNEAECETETPKAPISVEKAMEMWRSITGEGNCLYKLSVYRFLEGRSDALITSLVTLGSPNLQVLFYGVLAFLLALFLWGLVFC